MGGRTVADWKIGVGKEVDGCTYATMALGADSFYRGQRPNGTRSLTENFGLVLM